MHGYLISTPSGRKSKYKIFRGFCKNDREGGVRIFPELRKVLGCHMPNFRSLGQSLHIDNFCKIDGGGGGPYYPFGRQSQFLYWKRFNLFSFCQLAMKTPFYLNLWPIKCFGGYLFKPWHVLDSYVMGGGGFHPPLRSQALLHLGR